MTELFVQIEYNADTNEYKEPYTNVKSDKVREIISAFLRTQIGLGPDSSKPNDIGIYTIQIFLDLSNDEFTCKDNCGNKSLRDGILMQYMMDNYNDV